MLMEKRKSSCARLFVLSLIFTMNFYAHVTYGNNVLKWDECVVVQKIGFNTSDGYGFLEVSRHDSLFYLVTNDYGRYEELSVDSTYRFILRQRDEKAKIDHFSNCANPVYIYLGETRISLDMLASHHLYELVVMESGNVRTRKYQCPIGMNVSVSKYETFEDKALDYFCTYVSQCKDYSEDYIRQEWVSLQKKKLPSGISDLYVVHIAEHYTPKSGEIRKTSLNDVYMNVYVWKYNNNIIDTVVCNNQKYEPEFVKVDLKYKSPHRFTNKKRIISVCANCSYNNMNHVEVTMGNRKELQTYIIVMREDGSLFDIVLKEERKCFVLHYSPQL